MLTVASDYFMESPMGFILALCVYEYSELCITRIGIQRLCGKLKKEKIKLASRYMMRIENWQPLLFPRCHDCQLPNHGGSK